MSWHYNYKDSLSPDDPNPGDSVSIVTTKMSVATFAVLESQVDSRARFLGVTYTIERRDYNRGKDNQRVQVIIKFDPYDKL